MRTWLQQCLVGLLITLLWPPPGEPTGNVAPGWGMLELRADLSWSHACLYNSSSPVFPCTVPCSFRAALEGVHLIGAEPVISLQVHHQAPGRAGRPV
jgi:hypothetical protein